MPKIDTLPATASVQEMQRNYRKLLDKVKLTRRPLFLLRNNFPEAVLVDVQSWEELAARLSVDLNEDERFDYLTKEIEKKVIEKYGGKKLPSARAQLADID